MAILEPTPVDLNDGSSPTIRSAEPDDADEALRFLHEEVATSPYVLTTPGEILYTAHEERVMIQQRRDDPRSLWLLALDADTIVGATTMFPGARIKQRHNVDFGTTVAAAWRGRGLGRAMLEIALGWARAAPDVLRVTLDVMVANERARRMYELAGFRAIGVERRAYRQPDGTFEDGIRMELWVG